MTGAVYTRAREIPPRRALAPRRGPPAALASGDAAAALSLMSPKPLKPAKEFRVSRPDSRPLNLADFKGKVVFLNFWATWCKPCEEEMPSMERLYQRYKDKGLVVLAISKDADGAPWPPFVKKHGLTFPVGLDPKMAVATPTGSGRCRRPSSSIARAIARTSPMARGSGTARRPTTSSSRC